MALKKKKQQNIIIFYKKDLMFFLPSHCAPSSKETITIKSREENLDRLLCYAESTIK